jgi:hypothetical protein
MFGSPSVPEVIKAEKDYRHERTRRDFQSARRRERAERAGRPGCDTRCEPSDAPPRHDPHRTPSRSATRYRRHWAHTPKENVGLEQRCS